MPLVSVTEYDARQAAAAQRVLDCLDRLDRQVAIQHAMHRRYERKPFRAVATIEFLDDAGLAGVPGDRARIGVWARSLSRSGLSFICPGEIRAQHIKVGLTLPGGKQAWFAARIVRQRTVPETGFWEYGVAFTGRAES